MKISYEKLKELKGALKCVNYF